jgi:hypothetical protein
MAPAGTMFFCAVGAVLVDFGRPVTPFITLCAGK